MTLELDDVHCQHAVSHLEYDGWENGDDDDFCVHCDCCCTCLGCEYGPRDGMLMNPDQIGAES